MTDLQPTSDIAVQTWERTGLLQEVPEQNILPLANLLQGLAMTLLTEDHKDQKIRNLIFPIARRISDQNLFPEPAALLSDVQEWLRVQPVLPSDLSRCFVLDEEVELVAAYCKVAKERLSGK